MSASSGSNILDVIVFNGLFVALLKHVKNEHPSLRSLVKAAYRVVDKSNPDYYAAFAANVQDSQVEALAAAASAETTVLPPADMFVADGLELGGLLGMIGDAQKRAEVLGLVSAMAAMHLAMQGGRGATVAQLIIDSQTRPLTDEDFGGIVDDTLGCLLSSAVCGLAAAPLALPKFASSSVSAENTDADPTQVLRMLEGSKIGALAQDITKDLGSSLASNDFASIIREVSGKVHERLQSGEL